MGQIAIRIIVDTVEKSTNNHIPSENTNPPFMVIMTLFFAKEKVSSGKDNNNESDGVSAYTKLVLTLGLLRMDHNDAIHMGDGSRMLRIDQFLVLYYKYCHCTKYAFGTLETIAQTEVLLTERQAHRLIWNRTVNHKGDANTNHPNDLDVEHCNKVFKDSAHSYRGVFY
ncbi:unnamed protein product [Mytilus edulis]|uniref:DUF6589 domain-containing protein n=1 Tax=Mytilus edulis TaxID=6550 RepID=A0A8S3TJ74_MYTED|nr:unnamed protein product [Mytilus edulis]